MGAGAGLRAFALPPRPRLLILLIAEQFRTDYIDSHLGVFGAGGFRRLIDSGAYFPDCRIESTSFTATGLATIASGAWPSVHGIAASRWFDRSQHAAAEAARAALCATTFFSEFPALDARNRVFATGWNAADTELVSNGSVVLLDENRAPSHDQKLSWFALGAKSSVPMRSFAFDATRPHEFFTLWKGSPTGQAAQFAQARDIVTQEKLGRGAGLDCLTVVLGSLGELGRESGAASPLVFDLVSQLDRQIESFIDFLESTVGANGFQIVFTAAHGVADSPGPVINSEEIAAIVDKALGGQAVEAYLYPFLYLKKGDRQSRVAACQAAAQSGKVAAWFTADGDCSHSGDFRRRLANSFFRGRSGDAIFVYPPKAGEFFGHGRGVSYGSIYNYDTRVPLILRGPQFRPQTLEQPVELADLAPTLARAMGTPLPSSSAGRVLGEAFKA